MKILARANKKLRGNGKFYTIPEPTKSWFYVTEYVQGMPYKAKTLNCSGEMPYDYMYGTYNSNYRNVASRSLREFEINEGVTKIGQYAFENCLSLTSITIPKSITRIGYNAFMSCSNLQFVKIKSIESWCKISFSSQTSNPVFYAKQLYLNEEKVTDLIIPSSITTIKTYAFVRCNSLKSITTPDSVTSIGSNAFYDCSSLTSVTFGSGITSIGGYVFSGCSSCLLFDFRKATQVPTLANVNAFTGTKISSGDGYIYVPAAFVDSYKSATNWSAYASQIRAIEDYPDICGG